MTAPLISHSCGLKRVVPAAADGQLDLFEGGGDGRFVHAVLLDTDGQPEAARDLYWECVEAEERIADAFCNLAAMSYDGGDESLAREYLADALINEPAHGVAHYNVGTLALFKGENQLAILHYREALGEGSTLPCARMILPCARRNLAVALAQDGEYEDSLAELDQISAPSSRHGEEVRQLLEIVRGMQASQLPLQEEVERLIAALVQAKRRTTVDSGEMRSKEFRRIATAIQALQKLVS